MGSWCWSSCVRQTPTAPLWPGSGQLGTLWWAGRLVSFASHRCCIPHSWVDWHWLCGIALVYWPLLLGKVFHGCSGAFVSLCSELIDVYHMDPLRTFQGNKTTLLINRLQSIRQSKHLINQPIETSIMLITITKKLSIIIPFINPLTHGCIMGSPLIDGILLFTLYKVGSMARAKPHDFLSINNRYLIPTIPNKSKKNPRNSHMEHVAVYWNVIKLGITKHRKYGRPCPNICSYIVSLLWLLSSMECVCCYQ